MNATKTIFVALAVLLIGIFGISNISYALIDMRAKPPAGETVQGGENLDRAFPKPPDKGSPYHGWQAIVTTNKKAGDTITTQEFEAMRNWSARTRGYELQSLVAIGVLEPTGKKGEYRLLVDATPEQIDEIDRQIISLVDRTDVHKNPVGLQCHRLDAAYLGKEDVEAGNRILSNIRDVIQRVTRAQIQVPTGIADNFVTEDELRGVVPASVAIQEGLKFIIDGNRPEGYKGVTSETNTHALLAALVDIRLVSGQANLEGETYNFNDTKNIATLFQDTFVIQKTDEFVTEQVGLEQNENAVIIVINETVEDINRKLKEKGLAGKIGDKIIIMSVKPESPSAVAFNNLFKAAPFYKGDLDAILSNRQAVQGLEGAV